MGAMSFKNYIIVFLLAGLFIVSMYQFGTGIKANYDQDTRVLSDDLIDLTNLQTQINQTSQEAKAWEKSFTSDNLFVALGSIVLFSLLGIIKLMWSSTNTLVTIYLTGLHNVFGINPMVTGLLTAFLIIGLIFAAWRTLKIGE